MTTPSDPHAVLPSGQGQSPHTSLLSQLVREAFSGAPGAPSFPEGLPGFIPQGPAPAAPAAGAQPARADSVSVAASSLPTALAAPTPSAIASADPASVAPEAVSPRAFAPDRAAVPPTPDGGFFSGAYPNAPGNPASASGYPPVSDYAPAGAAGLSGAPTTDGALALDHVLKPDDLFAFGEPRFLDGYEDRQDSDTVIAQHHARHDSASHYYFLEQRRAPAASDAVPASVGPGETARDASGATAQTPPAAAHTAANAPRDGVLTAFESRGLRKDFPVLHQTVNGKPLVWLDNAATTQKPQGVIDITSEFYSRHNSNIHRAAHTLAARSTDLFEGARDKLRDFVGAASSREIVFVRGTTEAINLVANSYGQRFVGSGDEILITHIEHHANIVPWQLLAQRTGAVLKVAPVDDNGTLLLDRFAALLGPRTKLVSVTQVANALGTINPVAEIIALAHARGVPVLVDAAQSAPHLPIDVRALDADFLVLSGHKIFGPTGIGILYGKEHLLEALPPWQGGGHMIRDVTFEHTVFQGLPEKFEAGTPDIAGAVGLGAAVDYINGVGIAEIAAYEHALLDYANEGLATVPGLRLIGTSPLKASVLSFVVKGFEPEQVSRHLDKHGIATRSGHHCAQPALRRFGVEATVRASLALYNTREDVDALVNGLHLLPRR
ncbi:MAG: SufS family cysteine desulfurase [Pseudochelatococcus sp.]|jgi:cysteine desulfurase/selenocysteine lyase|uniref:SufS family cysteine desulfurase n=1 Tax=Pseudochelatococcus sp. TaxID=2020869 RepID=UPI003D9081FB